MTHLTLLVCGNQTNRAMVAQWREVTKDSICRRKRRENQVFSNQLKMCIAVFIWQAHPLYPFFLLLNRDEYHTRWVLILMASFYVSFYWVLGWNEMKLLVGFGVWFVKTNRAFGMVERRGNIRRKRWIGWWDMVGLWERW